MLHTLKKGAVATKRFVWDPANKAWGKTAYSMGLLFDARRYRVSGIQSLAALIEKARGDPTAFIIRGQLAEGCVPNAPVARRYLARPGKPAPHFIDMPRAWLMADIDGYPVPDGLDLIEDTEVLIERAIGELLPAEFHDVRAFWQLSSSAGFNENVLKAHVWFYLDRHVETGMLKSYMSLHARGIDKALFNPVQIHYTADPIVQGGIDPIPQRTGWVQGLNDFVTLPDLDAIKLAEQVRQSRRDAAVEGGLSPSQATTINGALTLVGDGPGLEGFHDPLLRAAWLYAKQTPTWARSLNALKERLRNATLAAPADRIARPEGVGRYLSDAFLDEQILGAFEKTPHSAGWETCVPEHKLRSGDAEEARDRMQQAIADFLAQPMTPPPTLGLALNPDLAPTPRRGLVVAEVGLGKSEKALREIVKFVQREKEAGRPHRVAYFIPEHELGADLLKRSRKMGIAAAPFYGRTYTPPSGSMMCNDPEAVEMASAAGANVGTFVCGPEEGNKPKCTWRVGANQCAYQFQKNAVADADMVVLAHATMFSRLPRDVATDLGLVVIDEAFWQQGLSQRDISVETFSQDALDQPVLKRCEYTNQQIINLPATNDLASIRASAAKGLSTSDDTYLEHFHIKTARLTAENCTIAGKLEWQRQRDIAMYPGMPATDRKAASDAAVINAQLPRLHDFWTAMRDLLEQGDASSDPDSVATGRIELKVQQRANGSQRMALLNTRKNFTKAILACPILLLDGTGEIDIVRHYLPDTELIAEEQPAAPHVTVHQVVGPLSKTSLLSRRELPGEVRDFIASKTEGKPSLIVTHVAIEQIFEGLPNTDVAHYGAIAGKDSWGRVRHIAALGRPQPGPAAVRDLAAQLTGRPAPLADPVRATRGVTMRDGTGVGIEVSRFEDPDAEMVRRAVTDAAIIQAGGRGRGVNRTVATPLDIWLLGNMISPWPVSEIVQWKDVALDPVSRMAVRGLVLFSPVDAHAVYGDLFITSKAAQHAIHRGAISAPTPYNSLYIREWGGNRLVGVSYLPKGRGQQIRVAWAAENRLETLAEELTLALKMPVTVTRIGGPNPEPPRPDPGTPRLSDPLLDDEAPWSDYAQPGPDEWDMPAWAVDLGEHDEAIAMPDDGEVLAQVALKPSASVAETSRRREVLLCDVPWLHPAVPAYAAPGGGTVVEACPFCGQQHQHSGFGHRLAHCDDQRGRGYVLTDMGGSLEIPPNSMPPPSRGGAAMGLGP